MKNKVCPKCKSEDITIAPMRWKGDIRWTCNNCGNEGDLFLEMEKENFQIRKAARKDIKPIAKILMKESKKKPYNDSYNLKTAEKEIKDCFKDEVYVGVINKEIIGFLASNIAKDNKTKGYIRELWVKPRYQGKGIGRRFIEFIEELYKKKGVKTVRVVSKKTSKAFKFYKKLNYYEKKDLVFMEKKLK